MDTRHKSTRIVMLPWLTHDQISPFLELARALSHRNFVIYICSTPMNLNSIRENLSEKDSISIKPVELSRLIYDPTDYRTTNCLLPHLMPSLKEAFSNILLTLKPDLVIYDKLQPWAPLIALSQHIPALLFLTNGAASVSYFCHLGWKNGSDFPFPAIYLKDYKIEECNFMAEVNTNGEKDSDKVLECVAQSSEIILIKTWREIEAKYIDYFSELSGKKIVPVGSIVYSSSNDDNDDEQNEIIEWLNKKERGSTLFASFGNEYFLKKEEIEEIGLGLEISGVNFIWVVRFPEGENTKVEREALSSDISKETTLRRDGDSDNRCSDISDRRFSRVEEALPRGFLERENLCSDISDGRFSRVEEALPENQRENPCSEISDGRFSRVEEALPRGFLQRVGERGMVVEGWAPKGKILVHESIGGYLNHCGFNSVIEGVEYGKPILALPMNSDQAMNARIVEELGIGKEIERGKQKKIDAGEIAKVIREVVVDRTRGEDLRRKAKELSEKIISKGEEEMDFAAMELVKLCRKTERQNSLEMLFDKKS